MCTVTWLASLSSGKVLQATEHSEWRVPPCVAVVGCPTCSFCALPSESTGGRGKPVKFLDFKEISSVPAGTGEIPPLVVEVVEVWKMSVARAPIDTR